jgi:hypothetical protein
LRLIHLFQERLASLFLSSHLPHDLFLLLLRLSLLVISGLINQFLEVPEHLRVVMMIFVGQRLHNVIAQDRQAAVLVLSLRQLIQLVHQGRGKDGLLGEWVVLGESIKET